MTKIVSFVADVHVGNAKRFRGATESGVNARARATLSTLSRAVQKSARTFVSLGDLIDVDHPNPQLLSAIQDVLGQAYEPICLLGNHEMTSTAPLHNALAALRPVADVVEVPTYELISPKDAPPAGLVLIPYRPGPAREWLEEAIASTFVGKTRVEREVLCVHLGISDDQTQHFLLGADDSISIVELRAIMVRHGLSLAVAGNWHRRRHWISGRSREPEVLQLGTLSPTGFSNPGWGPIHGVGTLAHLTSTGLEWEVIPGPRFIKVPHYSKIEETIEDAHETDSVFVEVSSTPEDAFVSKKAIEEFVYANRIVDGDVAIDRGNETEQATRAAASTSSPENLDRALEEYVRGMDLPSGVDRSAVLSAARGYCGR